MKIGLFFGSFNPIHNGHLILVNHILNYSSVKQIWFIISPQNPLKKSSHLMNEFDRLYFVQKAVENDSRIKASSIEFKLPKPSYTSVTLAYLKEKYPSTDFTIIMGSDSFQNLHKWKNSDFLVKNYAFIIYERPGYKTENNLNASIEVTDAPLLEISATYIRKLIEEKKSIKYLVPEIIETEIVNRFLSQLIK